MHTKNARNATDLCGHDVTEIGESPRFPHLADLPPDVVRGEAVVPAPLDVEGRQVLAVRAILCEHFVHHLRRQSTNY